MYRGQISEEKLRNLLANLPSILADTRVWNDEYAGIVSSSLKIEKALGYLTTRIHPGKLPKALNDLYRKTQGTFVDF